MTKSADGQSSAPDSTAVRVALWRALHVEVDAPPHVLHDTVGLELAAPEEGWRRRGDMDPIGTRLFRASIVARARFIEDLVVEQAGRGVDQYLILGAGLDTFAQRRPDVAAGLTIFEIDRPGPQAWKRRRLMELGLGVPERLKLVPVDFEAGASWRNQVEAAGFDSGRPAVIVSTGVSMYLSKEANAATLREIAGFAAGSTLAMTYILPIDMADPEERQAREFAERGARASGTPFVSFFTAPEIVALARDAGFTQAHHVPAAELDRRYFAGRSDGLRLSKSEEMLVATT
ncbi:MAG: class I SAM-dependent methyltransferase [Alphaproteobacteria bacterium]|nr:class I SAM-dependent methyltransferase [Alphaproteobacteria bacterium]MBV8406443.1 class I SAM-dependent methyltransferase [Alphaproteobacteria bacterium]